MVTKWFKNIINALSFGGFLAGNGGTGYAYNKPIKDRTNTTVYPSHSIGFATSFVSNNNEGIIFGTGNTPATDEDYEIESQITSGITVASPIISKGMDGDKCYITLRYVVSNTTSSDIIIKEVGLRGSTMCGTSAGQTTSISKKYILFDRTVLTTPLTVPASSNAVLEYTLESDWDLT